MFLHNILPVHKDKDLNTALPYEGFFHSSTSRADKVLPLLVKIEYQIGSIHLSDD
jgi:hypothetical protein